MCTIIIIIIKQMSRFWIIGLLVLWSGVITAGNVTAAPGLGTTTSNEISAFTISIKITNRIYSDSLEDNQSQNYKMLRKDVEDVFFEIYQLTPAAQYQEITEMTFSNGSVIANSTVLFGTKQSEQNVKHIFVTNYQQNQSLMLDLNINDTTVASITSPNSHTTTELSDHSRSGNENSSTSPLISTTLPLTINGLVNSADNNSATTATTQTPSTTNTSDVIHSTSRTTSKSTSDSSITAAHSSTITSTRSTLSPSPATVHSSSSMTTISSSSPSTTAVHPSSTISTVSSSSSSATTVHPSSSISTMSSSSPSTTTVHPSSSVSTMSSSSPSTTTVHPSSSISTMSSSSPSTTTVHPSSSISTTSSSSPSTTTVHPSSSVSTMSSSSSSVSPGKTTTQKSTGPEGSDTVATEQGVPGWGIAILVLAAIILFFMLVLLLLLLLFWCCWWRQRGFMNVSDPDPMGYYNHDIPMYSTHSTYDSHNGKSLDSGSERPHKNRTGTYAVNK